MNASHLQIQIKIAERAALLSLVGILVFPVIAHTAPVSIDLSGSGATGGVNIVGFDNEIKEPNAYPPSRDYVSPDVGNSSSHGFAYFQYKYDDNNPDAFNDYANEVNPSASLWSIIVSSHTVADAGYYASVLSKAGAVAYDHLTTSTLVPHPNPGAFNLGSLSYDDSLLTGVGTETLAPGQFSLAVTRSDYSFNVLNEPTEPGTWTGYPYYYWMTDLYSLSVSDITGSGLTFVDGNLASLDFQATATISHLGQTWEGTLTFSGSDFAFDIVDAAYVSGFGDLMVVMDRSGTLNLVPEPTAALLATLGLAAIALRRRRAGFKR